MFTVLRNSLKGMDKDTKKLMVFYAPVLYSYSEERSAYKSLNFKSYSIFKYENNGGFMWPTTEIE